jgi:hypothetical protein
MKTLSLANRVASALALATALFTAGCGGGGSGGGNTAAGNSGGSVNSGGGGTANSAPTIGGTPPDSVSAGTEFSFTPQTSDADGDRLTFAVENAPTWATFDPGTGNLAGTPFTPDLGEYAGIAVSVSDGKATARLQPFSITVTPQQLGEANFSTKGDVFPTANGYRSVGTLVMDTGERVQEFTGADLTVEFDDAGKVVSIAGTAELPVNLSDNVTVMPGIRAVVGMMSGAQINADPSFGITLLEETRYFVFFVDTDMSVTISNPFDPSDTIVENMAVPVGGQIVMILDATDPFLYRYASHPSKGAYGSGESFNALIPFKPELDYPGLDSFNGHTIEKGLMAMQLKNVTIGEVEGVRVIKNASFLDIDWNEPLDSPVEFRAGVNGRADIGVNVPIVGDFSFAKAELGATIDVGFDRQQAALAMYLDAEASSTSPWVPDWFHLMPSGEFDGEATINGTGEFSFGLFGSFRSTVPEAEVSGTMRIDNDEVTLAATTVQDGDDLIVSFEFSNNQTLGRVQFPEAYAATIRNDVSAALDSEIAKVEQALRDLQEATADYQFEASLRGLREALPPMMDAAVTTLNGVPDLVHDRAYDAAIAVMGDTCKTITVLGASKKFCLDDVVDEDEIASDIADRAKAETSAGIKSGVDAMKALKTRALEADDATLREALRQALDTVYNSRQYSRRVIVRETFSVFPFESATYTLYDETYTRTIISASDASRIATARDNVWRIQATSDIMTSAQQVYDLLPTEQIISDVRHGVQDGTRQVPRVEGLGYIAIGDTYDAFITVDGVDHVTDINVLRPSDVRKGVSDLLAALLLEAI